MLPFLSKTAPWFSFLVHARDHADLSNVGASSIIRHYSSCEEEFERKACSLPPLVIGELLFGFSVIHGELIGVMRMPHQVMRRKGSEAVRDAVDVAVRRGARVIGLGSLTSPTTRGGTTLLQHIPPSNVTLTNGNALTAALVRQNVTEAVRFLGLDRKTRVAVVGCTGSVGTAACRLLAEAGCELVLIGRTEKRAREALDELRFCATFSGDIFSARQADIVVLLSSNAKALLKPEMVRSEVVVIDVCQPANIPRSAYSVFARAGVTVVEGGYVRIPSYTSTFDLRTPSPTDTFACLAETYLFAKEGIREHSVGQVSDVFAKRMERIARRHGVVARPLELSRGADFANRLGAA